MADSAYTGAGRCVPRCNPNGQQLTDSACEYNQAIASHRARGFAAWVAAGLPWMVSG